MIAAGGEFSAVRAEGERKNRNRPRIAGRRIRVRGLRQERGKRRLGIRTIEFRTLANPAFDERDLRRRQRIVLLGHSIICIARRNKLE